MTTLVLVRHAKSDWGDPGLDDHDRPLNARGQRDAPAMAARLAGTGLRPKLVLSSTALRARSTAAAFADALRVDLRLDAALYGAPGSHLLAAAASTGLAQLVIVAHDPGMTVLAEQLSGGGIGHMPTCAVATFTWATTDWDVATAVTPDSWTFDSPR